MATTEALANYESVLVNAYQTLNSMSPSPKCISSQKTRRAIVNFKTEIISKFFFPSNSPQPSKSLVSNEPDKTPRITVESPRARTTIESPRRIVYDNPVYSLRNTILENTKGFVIENIRRSRPKSVCYDATLCSPSRGEILPRFVAAKLGFLEAGHRICFLEEITKAINQLLDLIIVSQNSDLTLIAVYNEELKLIEKLPLSHILEKLTKPVLNRMIIQRNNHLDLKLRHAYSQVIQSGDFFTLSPLKDFLDSHSLKHIQEKVIIYNERVVYNDAFSLSFKKKFKEAAAFTLEQILDKLKIDSLDKEKLEILIKEIFGDYIRLIRLRTETPLIHAQAILVDREKIITKSQFEAIKGRFKHLALSASTINYFNVPEILQEYAQKLHLTSTFCARTTEESATALVSVVINPKIIMYDDTKTLVDAVDLLQNSSKLIENFLFESKKLFGNPHNWNELLGSVPKDTPQARIDRAKDGLDKLDYGVFILSYLEIHNLSYANTENNLLLAIKKIAFRLLSFMTNPSPQLNTLPLSKDEEVEFQEKILDCLKVPIKYDELRKVMNAIIMYKPTNSSAVFSKEQSAETR